MFDQSKAGETFSFQLNRKQVIRGTFVFMRLGSEILIGWDEAIATMHVGEKATFFISADWAYGAYGHPPVYEIFLYNKLSYIYSESHQTNL